MKAPLTQMSIKADTVTTMKAGFQAWSDAFDAVGFAKHAGPTGQIVIASAVYPTAATVSLFHTEVGYEIRKLVLDGQPTVYARISYGVASGDTKVAANIALSLRFRFGTSVDAAGNIDGYHISKEFGTNQLQAPNVANTLLPLWIASDGANYFTMAISPDNMFSGLNYPYLGFGLERSRDRTSGAYDGAGFLQYTMGGTANWGDYTSFSGQAYYGTVRFSDGHAGEAANAVYACPGQLHGTTSGTGSAISTFPMLVSLPELKAQGTVFLGYWHAEVTVGTEFEVSMYGQVMRFVAMGNKYAGYDAGAGASYVRSAMRIN